MVPEVLMPDRPGADPSARHWLLCDVERAPRTSNARAPGTLSDRREVMSKEIPDDLFEVSHTDSNECDNESRTEVLRWIRDWEERGVLWSAIGADGRIKFYVGPPPASPDRDNVTMIGSAVRRRRREGKS